MKADPTGPGRSRGAPAPTMRLAYDAEADALAVELAPDARSARMTKLAPGVNADFDADGRLIAIEVLRAATYYPREALAQLASGADELSLAEAAAEAGLRPATLRVQLNHGRLVGRKRGRDWVVSRAALLNYLESRGPAGRPAAGRTLPGRRARRRMARASS